MIFGTILYVTVIFFFLNEKGQGQILATSNQSIFSVKTELIDTNHTGKEKHYLKDENFTLKNILLFSPAYWILEFGAKPFLQAACPINNCYLFAPNETVTRKKFKYMDAILFHLKTMKHDLVNQKFPGLKHKYLHQKFIFIERESEANFLLPPEYDNFFNWTISYKLNSDIFLPYFYVRDLEGNVVAPKRNVEWIKMTKPVNYLTRYHLGNKRKAVAWLVSNCEPKSKRNFIAIKLDRYLKAMKLKIDVYGKCGLHKCGSICEKLIKDQYYFYLAFENSISDDYVTEKVLLGYNNYAVPIVYGGANYTKFLPPGSYIDIRKTGILGTAIAIARAIKNRKVYLNYYKWRNYYRFEDSETRPDMDYLCKLCEWLNNRQLMENPSIHSDLSKWWHEKRDG